MPLQDTMKAVVRSGEESGYVADCIEIPVVTQGATLDQTLTNLKEAVALQLEGEDLSRWGLSPQPMVIVAMEY